VAEAADQAHSVKLASLLLEPSNEQHLSVETKKLFGVLLRPGASIRFRGPSLFRCRFRLGYHWASVDDLDFSPTRSARAPGARTDCADRIAPYSETQALKLEIFLSSVLFY
jgi:hypothetical protein